MKTKKKEFLNNFLKVVEITTAYYLGCSAADRFLSDTFWQRIGLTALFLAILIGVETLVRGSAFLAKHKSLDGGESADDGRK